MRRLFLQFLLVVVMLVTAGTLWQILLMTLLFTLRSTMSKVSGFLMNPATVWIPWFDFSGTNDENLRIGCAKGKPEYAFEDVFIDEIAIWSRALSEDEIRTAMRGNFLAVSPKDKVATTWSSIKRKAF